MVIGRCGERSPTFWRGDAVTLPSLELGAIGNCTLVMLLDPMARIVWGCFPRLDCDPIFSALLNGPDPMDPADKESRGYFAIELEGCVRSEQSYVPNSAILSTCLHDDKGNVVEIMDFA